MESEIFLSLIVPVYNVAPYVEQCIRSLYQQDIPTDKYEVIVIDDCSTDNSQEILVRLQNEYSHLKLILLNENVKQGSVRNIGLQQATGQYIWYIDSDDYIQPEILNSLVQELNNNQPEILHFNYQILNNDEAITPYRANYTLNICTGAEFYFDANELWWQKGIEVWRQICKKSFLTDNKLQFAEKVKFEDTDYSIKMFSIAQKVQHLDIAPYFYRNNSSSTTNSPATPLSLKYWLLLCLRCNELKHNFIKDKNVDPRFVIILEAFIKHQLSYIYSHLKRFDKTDRDLYRNIISGIMLNPLKKYIPLRKYFYIKYPILGR